MKQMLEKHQAEAAPLLTPGEQSWYLPIFEFITPRNQRRVRLSLTPLHNAVLSGPDLNNKLIGVLPCFRRELVTITDNVEQMFYCFRVREDHQNYLKFLWFQDNDLTKDVAEFHMKVHVFGNSPSPAVAIYGLRWAAELGEEQLSSEAVHL